MKTFVSKLTLFFLAAQISAVAYGDYYPSYGRDCCCPSSNGTSFADGFFVRADYLYWTIQEDQLQYAVKIPVQEITNQIQAGEEVSVNLPIKEHKFDWNSGFRVGIGYNAPCTNWDVALNWTYLRENSHSHASDPKSGLFPSATPLFGIADLIREISGGGTIQLANLATSKVKFLINEIDLEWGATCCQCWNVNFRPYIGLKGASIQQRQKIKYEGLIGPASVVNKNDFWGVGPRLGIDASWNVGCNVNIVSSMACSLLYGRFKTSHDPLIGIPQVATVGASLSQADPFLSVSPKFSENKHKVRPALEMMLGFNWQSSLYEMPLMIGCGYEFQYWWNQWEAPTSMVHPLLNEGSSHGDLILQGLTVSATLSF